MVERKKILAILGSASRDSANLYILKIMADLGLSNFDLDIFEDLTELPHFKTELTSKNVPEKIVEFRNRITNADGIIICTPEYIFSIPSRLKNAIEWCVSTTVFLNKPTGLITASASGEKGHEELKLIMETVQAKFSDQTMLLIKSVKGKVSEDGLIVDEKTETQLKKFVLSFVKLTEKPSGNTVKK